MFTYSYCWKFIGSSWTQFQKGQLTIESPLYIPLLTVFVTTRMYNSCNTDCFYVAHPNRPLYYDICQDNELNISFFLADTGHCNPMHSEECPEVSGCARLAVVAPSHKGTLQRRLSKPSLLLEGKVFWCSLCVSLQVTPLLNVHRTEEQLKQREDEVEILK